MRKSFLGLYLTALSPADPGYQVQAFMALHAYTLNAVINARAPLHNDRHGCRCP